MSPKLTKDQISTLANHLLGTTDSIETGLSRMDLDSDDYDIDEIENLLVDHTEVCPGCGWWVETWELVDSADEFKLCDNCEPFDDE